MECGESSSEHFVFLLDFTIFKPALNPDLEEEQFLVIKGVNWDEPSMF